MIYFIFDNVLAFWVQICYRSNPLALAPGRRRNTLVRVNFVAYGLKFRRLTFHEILKRLAIRFIA